MKTLNSLKIELEAIVSSHDFLNAFYYGDILEIISQGDDKIYPAIFCTIEGGGDAKFYNNFTIELLALDKVSDDHKELVEVESDTYQYLKDFTNIMRYSPRWQHFSTFNSITAIKTKFIDITEDKLTGWSVIIDIGLKANYGICDLPLTGYDYGAIGTPSCADARIFVNDEFYKNVLSGTLQNIPVLGTDLNPLPTEVIGENVIATCPAGTAIDIDLNGVLMRENQSVDVDIPIYLFGTTDPIGSGVLGAAWFIQTHDTAGNQIGSEVLGIVVVGNSVVSIFKSDGTTLLHTVNALAENTASQNIGDSTVALFLSNGTTLLRNIVVLAENTENETLGLATVNIFEADGTSLLYSKTVDAEQTTSQNIADGVNTFNGGAVSGIVAEGTKAFEVVNDAAIPIDVGIIDTDTKGLLKIIVPAAAVGLTLPFIPITGQRTIYQTGDDGDDATAGDFDDSFKLDFFNLTSANPTWPQHNKRFTGSLGGYKDELTGNWFDVDGVASDIATELPDNFYYDHLTEYKYYRFRTGTMTWTAGINTIITATIAGESGFKNVTKKLYESLMIDEDVGGNFPNFIDAEVFNFSTFTMWCDTTYKKGTTQAYRIVLNTATIQPSGKAGTNAFAYCKPF